MGTSKLGWKSVRIVRNHFSQNLAGRRAMCSVLGVVVDDDVPKTALSFSPINNHF